MIRLYTFGPAGNVPDPSPFVIKAMVLLKLAGLPYAQQHGGLNKAPKGKLPFIDDGGTMVADTTFIRLYLETTYKIDFDKGLTAPQRAHAWALDKLCEDHFYFLMMRERWMDGANFDAGPRRFFNDVPAPVRPFVIAMVRRQVKRDLKGQGLGRHSHEELAALGRRSLDAISDVLGDKPFLFGEEPCGADATAFGFVANCFWEPIRGCLRAAAEERASLKAYRDRGMARWFPDFKPVGA